MPGFAGAVASEESASAPADEPISRAPAAPGLVDVIRFAMPPARVLLEAIGGIVTAELEASTSTSSDQASEPDHVSRRDPFFSSSPLMARVHAWSHLAINFSCE